MSDFIIEAQGDKFCLTPISEQAKKHVASVRWSWAVISGRSVVFPIKEYPQWMKDIEAAGMTCATKPVVPFNIQAQGEVRNPGG